MAKLQVASLLVLVLFLAQSTECGRIFAAYFPNWAQHRQAPYAHRPQDLEGIIDRVDLLIYAFAYIDPLNYSVVLTQQNDSRFISEITSYKSSHPDLKVLISIGGPYFPSANFSEMASKPENRSAFVTDLKLFMDAYNLDGVDISWQYPCSEPKTIYLTPSCDNIITREDSGGTCPEDAENYLQLLTELREALGNESVISITGPPSLESMQVPPPHLMMISDYVDYWNIAAYDYNISTLNTSCYTAPNSPLDSAPNTTGLCINSTVDDYLSVGVPASKIIVGIPFFGHTWYVPGLKKSKWQDFGLKASIQGKCCGPFEFTYGAKYGQGSQMCGTYMYSEIVAAGVKTYYNEVTQTAIGYVRKTSDDGWTEAGTWFSFNDKNSIKAITQFIDDSDLAGAYVFDTSQDSINATTGQFTYELMEAVYRGLQGGGSICYPAADCNTCSSCCKSYLTNRFDCEGCVVVKCNNRKNVCSPSSSSGCNVCPTCCKSFLQNTSECNYCVKKVCN